MTVNERVIHSNEASDYCFYECFSESLASLNNVDSFSNETLLCCSETQNAAVALIETSSADLSKNSQ